jgi:hypothetical protein
MKLIATLNESNNQTNNRIDKLIENIRIEEHKNSVLHKAITIDDRRILSRHDSLKVAVAQCKLELQHIEVAINKSLRS